MKIAFWSISNEKCNVATNLAAICVAGVIRYPYTMVLIENRLSNNNMGNALIRYHNPGLFNEVGTNYYDGGGIEGLLRKIYRGKYDSDIIKAHMKEIISQHLYYIPQSRVIHNNIFDYEFEHCHQTLFQILEDNYDICMINADSQNNLSANSILEEADLIVVNLCQKQQILENFFDHYSSLLPKALFIISDYDSRVYLNSKRISFQYQIPRENLLVIPANPSYQNAYNNGSVVEFFYRNYNCPKTTPNYIFVQTIKKAAYAIIKKTEENLRMKEQLFC